MYGPVTRDWEMGRGSFEKVDERSIDDLLVLRLWLRLIPFL